MLGSRVSTVLALGCCRGLPRTGESASVPPRRPNQLATGVAIGLLDHAMKDSGDYAHRSPVWGIGKASVGSWGITGAVNRSLRRRSDTWLAQQRRSHQRANGVGVLLVLAPDAR